ncbi:DNA-3-methyladenine glycosylase [Chitinophaga polysaccharea]|uniref:DNA-3-methyladenine glycosylase n=1 Tax=Chitinophaga polysaccharea TaxID=1293035 RepID=UPI001455B189|nr:DNA-3-methyladenine glycosylase [Chitinophaga polysaccharea]NLR62382.1 DNA-3-methyladenine glycosylase [Chitinophaga polysaccharea]
MAKKLPLSFYRQDDVTSIARQLLGKVLVTAIDGVRTAGIIVETEAYAGIRDRASHAWNDRRTERTEVMYQPGGLVYVYLCYGLHYLFNVVTNVKEVPEAVLVRALEPLDGIDAMQQRYPHKNTVKMTAGPGSLCKALGIDAALNGEKLTGSSIWIEDAPHVPDAQILAGTRVGVQYAGEDALLPYRFSIKDNRWVSKGKGL